MGTGDILPRMRGWGGGALRWSSRAPAVQERVAKLKGMLHATETWINSGRLGLWHWPFCAFIFFLKPRLAVNQSDWSGTMAKCNSCV